MRLWNLRLCWSDCHCKSRKIGNRVLFWISNDCHYCNCSPHLKSPLCILLCLCLPGGQRATKLDFFRSHPARITDMWTISSLPLDLGTTCGHVVFLLNLRLFHHQLCLHDFFLSLPLPLSYVLSNPGTNFKLLLFSRSHSFPACSFRALAAWEPDRLHSLRWDQTDPGTARRSQTNTYTPRPLSSDEQTGRRHHLFCLMHMQCKHLRVDDTKATSNQCKCTSRSKSTAVHTWLTFSLVREHLLSTSARGMTARLKDAQMGGWRGWEGEQAAWENGCYGWLTKWAAGERILNLWAHWHECRVDGVEVCKKKTETQPGWNFAATGGSK